MSERNRFHRPNWESQPQRTFCVPASTLYQPTTTDNSVKSVRSQVEISTSSQTPKTES